LDKVLPSSAAAPQRLPFLSGVFLITFAGLVLQIAQTRVLSVIAWYYLAFFAISVAMLGMTVGAVWVYLRRARFPTSRLSSILSDYSLACAISIPASLLVQFSLIISVSRSLATVMSWTLLLVAMAVPYVFAGVVVSLALTRSPFPVSHVYGVDLIGAALGCVAVVGILNVLDGPSTIILAGLVAALAAWSFAAAAPGGGPESRWARKACTRPVLVAISLLAVTGLNSVSPIRIRPIMVKDRLEGSPAGRFERWNSYSRIVVDPPGSAPPFLWSASAKLPRELRVPQVAMDIDGSAGTMMPRYDGSKQSIDYLRYDLVSLAYRLSGIRKAAVIGVGGGRDVLTAHLFDVPEIVGVELNPIFIWLHTGDPVYKPFSNLSTLPGLQLHVDDARSWFASTDQKFDLIQMSMIDTWAATGAGAFSLSENGLYTLEGWRAFLKTLNDGGVFTVSRWYNPGDVNETGRMIGLGTAALLDAGVADARPHLFVARASTIATLVLSKRPFTAGQLQILHEATRSLGFGVLLAPDRPPESALLRSVIAAPNLAELDRVVGQAELDLTVPTDNRPFFFNQLRFSMIPTVSLKMFGNGIGAGVMRGNLTASLTLVLILAVSILAVAGGILLPLRSTGRGASRSLIGTGTAYFALIGMGFMFAEISLLQYFGIYLGHPIYSLGVCLFSLILASGIGSLASGSLSIGTPGRFAVWACAVGGYLLFLQHVLTALFAATTAEVLPVRVAVSLAVVMPLGFLLGFAFPTGMRLIEAIDPEPTPWFWGINGATGVLASVLAVMLSMAYGINVTMALAGLCYLGLIPVSRHLLVQVERKAASRLVGSAGSSA
jgi:hypothetical protein